VYFAFEIRRFAFCENEHSVSVLRSSSILLKTAAVVVCRIAPGSY